MVHRLHVYLLLFLVTCSGPLANAKEPAKVPGPEIGDKAPNFKLPDQNGEVHELEKLLRQGPVALVFHRSAEW